MGAKNVLTLVQDYCKERALAVPSALFASTDPAVMQFQQLLNKTGREIRAKRDWQRLKRRKTHTVVAPEDQGLLSSILGEDPDHIIFETLWNDSQGLPVYGPLSDAEYQQEKALEPEGPFQNYKIMEGRLYLLAPTAGETISCIIKSLNWLQTTSSSGVYVEEITADANVPIWPDDLMLLGLDFFWLKVKKIEHGREEVNFYKRLAEVAAYDNIQPVITMHASGLTNMRPGIIVPGQLNL